MAETADILIIGGGVMGTSIAYHLAKQGGSRVVLLECIGVVVETAEPISGNSRYDITALSL